VLSARGVTERRRLEVGALVPNKGLRNWHHYNSLFVGIKKFSFAIAEMSAVMQTVMIGVNLNF